MGWLYLLLAGVFELGFTTSLKMSDSFSRLGPSILVLVFGSISLWLLSRSLMSIPIGTAYAIWTGMGAFGTVVIGMLFFSEPISVARIVLLTTLVLSIIGLKFVTPG